MTLFNDVGRQSSLAFMEENASAPVADGSAVYKPSLTVDVRNAICSGDDPGAGATPKVVQTPHTSTNIFIAGLPSSWNEDALRERYSEFGEIISTKVVPSRHFGFVMFRRADSAHKAINATHLTKPMESTSNILHVSIAMHDEGVDEIPNERIFVRGLPQWATKDHLRQCFSTFGTIVDCAVLMNPQGQCKGSGFVHFSSVAEATAALKGNESLKIEGCEHALEAKFSETREVRQQRQERNRHRQRNWGTTPKYYGSDKFMFPGAVIGNSGNNMIDNTVGAFGFKGAVSPGFVFDQYLSYNCPLPGNDRTGCVMSDNMPAFSGVENIYAGGNPSTVLSGSTALQLAHLPSGMTSSFVPSPTAAVYPNHAVPLQSPSQGGVGGFNLIAAPVPFPMMYSLPAVPVTPTPLPSPQPTRIVYSPQLVSSSVMTTGGGLYPNSSVYVVNKPSVPQVGDLNFSGSALSEDVLRVLLQPYGPINEMIGITGSGDIAVRMKDTNQHALIAQHLNGTKFRNGENLAVGIYA